MVRSVAWRVLGISADQLPALRAIHGQGLGPTSGTEIRVKDECEISSKQLWMSPSTIHSYERDAK